MTLVDAWDQPISAATVHITIPEDFPASVRPEQVVKGDLGPRSAKFSNENGWFCMETVSGDRMSSTCAGRSEQGEGPVLAVSISTTTEYWTRIGGPTLLRTIGLGLAGFRREPRTIVAWHLTCTPITSP